MQYLEQNIIFDGEIHIPVLTMHTTGDGLVINENESAYRTIVDLAGNAKFLRQTFVSRAGHCAFTPAETIAAVGTLLTRVETGHWPTVEANVLNGEATALGPSFNIFPAGDAIVPTPPAFVDFIVGSLSASIRLFGCDMPERRESRLPVCVFPAALASGTFDGTTDGSKATPAEGRASLFSL